MTGKIILSQLKATSQSMHLMMCWGFQKPLTFQANQLPELGNHEGGLIFTVSGLLFRGEVFVTLTPMDTYTVSFGSFKGKKAVIKSSFSDIYAEDLTMTIDRFVEKAG